MKNGEKCKILSVAVDGTAGERLSSLGIKAGAEATLIAVSLFRSSALISVGYNRIAIRKSVAQRIEVQPC